jgi:hypothetical protein
MSKENTNKLKESLTEKQKELKLSIAEHNPEALFADGHDHAIMGYSSDGRVIYSVDLIVESLMEDMSHEEAVEYFGFNIECAYVGEYTPIYMYEE